MPRRIFAAGSVTNTTGAPLRLEFYPTSTSLRREVDLWTIDGSSNLVERISNGVIVTDSVGAYSAFAGPDDLDTLYVLPSNTTTRTALTGSSSNVPGSTTYATLVTQRFVSGSALYDYRDRTTLASIPGLVADWNADNIRGVADGAGVSSWPDASGNGNTLTQATSGNQPLFNAAGVGGKPSVFFTAASSQYLSMASPVNLPSRAPVTVLAVIQPTGTADKQIIEYASTSSNGWGFGLQGANRFVQFVTYGVKAYISAAGIGSGTTGVVAAQFKTDFSVSADRDNNQVPAVTGTTDIAGTPATVTIGAKQVSTIQYFDGHIRRVVVFNRTLTNDEVQQAHRILGRDVVPLQSTFYNAASPLTIPTYDGSNQLVHMDVVAPPGGVLGYKYVMAMTPLPNDVATYENPSIVVSQDNVTWAPPPGLTNPLDTAPLSGVFNSDTDLTWDGTRLWLLFRTYTDTPLTETLYLMSTTDLVNWTAKRQILQGTGSQSSILSPAIVWDGSQYVMYCVNEVGTSPLFRKIQRRTATAITGPWSAAVDCNIPKLNLGVWHVDAQVIAGKTVLLLNDRNTVVTRGTQALYFVSSGDGINFVGSGLPVIAPVGLSTGWDSFRMYRSTFQLSYDGTRVRVWYAGSLNSGSVVWKCGYTEIPVHEIP